MVGLPSIIIFINWPACPFSLIADDFPVGDRVQDESSDHGGRDSARNELTAVLFEDVLETCIETTNLDVYLPNPKFAMAGNLSVRLHDRPDNYAFLFVLKSVHAY